MMLTLIRYIYYNFQGILLDGTIWFFCWVLHDNVSNWITWRSLILKSVLFLSLYVAWSCRRKLNEHRSRYKFIERLRNNWGRKQDCLQSGWRVVEVRGLGEEWLGWRLRIYGLKWVGDGTDQVGCWWRWQVVRRAEVDDYPGHFHKGIIQCGDLLWPAFAWVHFQHSSML